MRSVLSIQLLCLFILSKAVISATDKHITITSVSHHKKQDNHLFITILTEIQNNFYRLSDPQLITTPDYNPNNLIFHIGYDDNIGNECINDDQQIAQCCYQTLIISSTNHDVECPLSLKGSFKIKFDIQCNDEQDTLLNECTEYIQQNGDETILEASITYKDTMCDPQIFNVGNPWRHDMTFFKDAEFKEQMEDEELYDPFDICYAQINIKHPPISYDVSTITLENVWLCSVPPLTDDIFSFEGQGCFDDGVDEDGPYWIIKNHGEGVSMFDATIISMFDTTSTVIRYSFVIPKIERDTLYIHNQLSIEYGQQTMILMVFGHTKIVWNAFVPYNYNPKTKITFLHSGKRWMVILAILTAILMVMMMILMVSMKMFGAEHSKEVYDTEDEVQLINKENRIRINNVPLSMQCDDINNEEEEESEYLDLENEHKDPLDDSY